jgi:lipid-binding SYLF domain-containing protein
MKEETMRASRFSIPMIVVALTSAYFMPVYADQYTETMALYQKSETVRPFFNNAYGYAVFPAIGKGGLGIGGAYGNGLVYRGGKVTGVATLIKVSVGFQAGGQAFSEMIFFEDKRAFDEFTSGEFAFDATASAVAITAAAQAKAGTEGITAGVSAGTATGVQATTGYYKGMAVFVHALGGLMYEAAIGGQKFSYTPVRSKVGEKP